MARPTQADIEEMAEYYRLKQAGLTAEAIGARFGKSGDYISSKVYRYKQHYMPVEIPPEFLTIHLGTPLALEGDFVIVGDIHAPTTDYEFCMRAAAVGKKQLAKGNRRLIIGGDFFSQDSFSKYDKVGRLAAWHEERDAGRVLLKAWLEVFDEIYIIMGNHDRRMQKWSAGAFDESDIFGMLIQNPRVTVSNFGYLTAQTESGPWRITHSTEYSINAGTVGSELAQKFQCNIVSHHQHHANSGLDRYKRYATIDNGCMADFTRFAYVNMDDSKKPNMTNAFTLLKNGVGHLLWKHPAKTDWARWV